MKLILLIVAGLLSARAFGTTVPLDGTWYTGSNNGTPSLSDPDSDSFVWGTDDSTTATAQKGTVWTYFDPMSLANDGDSITLSLTTVPVEDATAHSFRLGLFNSGGSKVLNNLDGTNSDSGFSGSVGYYAQWEIDSSGGAALYTRQTGYTQPLSSKVENGAIHVANTETTVGLKGGTSYDIAISVTRNSDSEYLVTSSIDDTVMSGVTSTIAATSFDMVNILTPPTGIDSYEFSNFQVEYVPEPATMLLLGLGSVGLLRRKR